MKKAGKTLTVLLMVLSLILGLAACGGSEDTTTADHSFSEEMTTEGDPDYNVEDDLVEGVLTEEMLDEMAEEEASTEEKEETSTEEADSKKDKFAHLKKYYIKVNRRTNVVTIYTYDENGKYTKPVKAMVCSTGSGYGTPAGTFKLSSKHRWQLMNGGVYSQYASRITGHILFHSVPYSQMRNDTLITRYYNQLGVQASAGCVRLTCADAKWIYSNCASGTVVEIYDGSDTGPLGKPGSIRISYDSPYRGWDPTDSDPDNPWKKAKPTISGAKNFSVEYGEEDLDLKDGVTATDAYGKELKVSVSGNVNVKKAGKYTITYSATDSRGNSVEKSITVTVKKQVTTEAPEETTTATKPEPEETTTATKPEPEETTTATKQEPEETTTATKQEPEETTTATKQEPAETTTATKQETEETTTAGGDASSLQETDDTSADIE